MLWEGEGRAVASLLLSLCNLHHMLTKTRKPLLLQPVEVVVAGTWLSRRLELDGKEVESTQNPPHAWLKWEGR